jgi:hypothetical protein
MAELPLAEMQQVGSRRRWFSELDVFRERNTYRDTREVNADESLGR